MNLRSYLEWCAPGMVKAIAGRRGFSQSKVNKAGAVDVLVALLFDPRWLEQHLREIGKEQRAVLEKVRDGGGLAHSHELEALLRRAGVKQPVAHLRGIMVRGLLLYTEEEVRSSTPQIELPSAFNETWPNEHGHVLWLPPEVAKAMGPRAEPLPEKGFRLEEYPGQVQAKPAPFATVIGQLYTLAQGIRELPVGLTQAGALRKPDVARLAGRVGDIGALTMAGAAELTRGDLLFGALIALGAVRLEERRYVAAEEGFSFFAERPGEQARKLLQAWYALVFWKEILRVPEISVDTWHDKRVLDHARLLAARRLITQAIAVRGADRAWVSFASLLAAVKEMDDRFLFPLDYASVRKDGSQPYPNVSRRGKYGDERHLDRRHDWELVEGGFIRAALTEPLHWLGIVELGMDAAGHLVAFRLTPEGAEALGVREAEEPKPDEAARGLVVQPNFDLVLLPDVAGFGAAVELEKFADRVSVDRAILFRLTRESVYRGLRAGVKAAQMAALLVELSRTPLPQNVRHSLEEWGRSYTGLRLHRGACVITAGTPEELRHALRGVGLQCDRPLGPKAGLATKRTAERAAASIKGAARCDYGSEPAGVLTVADDGTLTIRPGKATPYLAYRLKSIAQPTKKRDVWTLDSDLTRAALANGMTANDVDAFLGQAAGAELPARVRLWLGGLAGAYGDVAVTLVCALSGPKEVIDLAAKATGIGEHLTARLNPNIVLLRTGTREGVMQTLEECGIPVRTDIVVLRDAPQEEATAGETITLLPPREIRAFLERAAAGGREVVIAYLGSNGRLTTSRFRPTGVTKSGSSYRTIGIWPDGREVTIGIQHIHGVREA